MKITYSYLVKITTWAEENGVEEDFTYTREFKDPDIRISQKKASEYWSKQMDAFDKGEIMPGFLGPKDLEGEDWNWLEKVNATLYFVIEDDGNIEWWPLSGGATEVLAKGQEKERHALKTLGCENKGMFD